MLKALIKNTSGRFMKTPRMHQKCLLQLPAGSYQAVYAGKDNDGNRQFKIAID